VTATLESILAQLAAGADRFTRRAALGRAALARDTARAVAAAADHWIDAAVAIETSGGAAADPRHTAIVGEETATGPLTTLRLLLTTERVWADIDRHGLPQLPAPPGPIPGEAADTLAVDVLPEPRLFDGLTAGVQQATVRCGDPGGVAAFEEAWRQEIAVRPRTGGVAAVLGAGNVTGLAAADAICQIFEHGRAAVVKLHPLHAPLETVYRDAFAPLIEAGMLAIVSGGADVAQRVCAAPEVSHVHLTGGAAAFEAIVWGARRPRPTTPVLSKSISCELGNVTPWIVVPGRYALAHLRYQADLVAASIANNGSFNCIATKCLVTCRQWPQREAFLELVAARLASLPPRAAWYPGSAACWQEATGRPMPADGTLPWSFTAGVDPWGDRRLFEREWFAPVAVEVPLDAMDVESFYERVGEFTRSLPGSLAASVTIPPSLGPRDRRRTELLVEHLRYGAVAVNTWVAMVYRLASLPWGGFPGGTLADPRSGIGKVHDPLLLPLVRSVIITAPLASRLTAPWVPWHRSSARLARGLLAAYAAVADGRSGVWPLVRMTPALFAA